MTILAIVIIVTFVSFAICSLAARNSPYTPPPENKNISVQNHQTGGKYQKYKQIMKKSSTSDNMNCDLYIFSARYSETKRMHRNHIIPVFDSNNVESAIIQRGYESPIEYEQIEFEHPTDKQLDYLRDLSDNNIPENLSKDDASALIDRYVSNDRIPNPDLFNYASQMDIPVSYYCGKKRLYNTIFENLPLRDAIAFFAFCVYRDEYDSHEIANLNYSPYKKLFYDYSDSVCNNDSIVKSMYRYQGKDLRYFGTHTFKGREIHGGSKNTIAYKSAVQYLRQKTYIANK